MDIKNKKILITGGGGFLGTHVVAALKSRGVVEEDIVIPRFSEYDLRMLEACKKVVQGIDVVIHLAATVGGIGFNQVKPGELFYDNIVMGAQLIDEAHKAGVGKFLAVGTVCSYPKFTPVPFRETDLWTGYPEETNAPYGLAKKALLVQADAYRREFGSNIIFLIPVNLYGPGDTFDPGRSHVIPALIKKIADAKREGKSHIDVWGTGMATREFLYVEDAAKAIVSALEKYDKSEPVNLGSGNEISIKDLITQIAELMEFKGEIKWDSTKPDGQPRRMLDITRAEQEFGFRAQTSMADGLRKTIDWYLGATAESEEKKH